MATTQIEKDAAVILNVLAEAPRDEYVDRDDVSRLSALPPERVNDAVALLVDSGYAEWIQTFGTAPYDFNAVTITSRGRYENQRLAAAAEQAGNVPTAERPKDLFFGTSRFDDHRDTATLADGISLWFYRR